MVTAQHQRDGALGNMSTAVQQVTVVRSAKEARRVMVPPFAVVSINCTSRAARVDESALK